MKEQLVDNYRSNPGLANLREMQVKLSYVYRDKHGETVATITVSPRDRRVRFGSGSSSKLP
jgi:hypothetical protein